MTTPIHNRFVSCEDHLPPILDGISNMACTVTGILLLYLPYRTHCRLSRILPTTKQKHWETTLYRLALTYLFYANLHQHMFGLNALWDLDVGGALHSIFLSLLIYEHSKHVLSQQFSLLPRLSTTGTRVLALAATLVVVVATATHRLDWVAAVGAVAALTVVPTLGYLSWSHREVDQSRAFYWWLVACVAVKGAEWLVVQEKSLCADYITSSSWTNQDNHHDYNNHHQPVLRLFHAIVIHAEIYVLFLAVTECSISVIQFCKTAHPTNDMAANSSAIDDQSTKKAN